MKLHQVIHQDGFYWYTPTVLREPIIVRIVSGEVWETGSEHPTTHLPGEFAGPIHHYTTVTMGESAQPTLADCIRRFQGAALPNEITEEMLIAAQKADGDHGDARFWREYGNGYKLIRMWPALVGAARGYRDGGIVPQESGREHAP